MDKSLLSEDDIFINQVFESCNSYYERICDHLLREEKVDINYLHSIKEREKKFPTGLNTGKICVAIPHTDFQHCKTNQLVITTLKRPVYFKQMDDPTKLCGVNIIIQILFYTPDKQVELLKQLMNLIQNQNFLQDVLDAKNKKTILDLFEKGN